MSGGGPTRQTLRLALLSTITGRNTGSDGSEKEGEVPEMDKLNNTGFTCRPVRRRPEHNMRQQSPPRLRDSVYGQVQTRNRDPASPSYNPKAIIYVMLWSFHWKWDNDIHMLSGFRQRLRVIQVLSPMTALCIDSDLRVLQGPARAHV